MFSFSFEISNIILLYCYVYYCICLFSFPFSDRFINKFTELLYLPGFNFIYYDEKSNNYYY